MKHSLLLSALVLGVSLALPVQANSATPPVEKLIAELAEKPANHKVLAQYYRDQAAAVTKDLAKHKNMRDNYDHYNKSTGPGNAIRMHCDRLIGNLESTKTEYEAMAELHAAEAKKL